MTENTKALPTEVDLKTSLKWQPHCLGLKVLKHRGRNWVVSIWKNAFTNLFLNLGAVWIKFCAIWINLKTLSVKWRPHCVGLNVSTYCGKFLVVSISHSTFPNQFLNLGAMWIKYYFHTIVWKIAAILSRPQCANILLLKQNSFYFADDVIIYIFEFVLLLLMQFSYLKMNLKSSSTKYRPYCLCLDVLTHCGRDKVTSILKTTCPKSFLTCRWNLNKIQKFTYLKMNLRSLEMAVMLSQLQSFEGETKWLPFWRRYIQINFPVWICFIILSNLTSNAVHRMTSPRVPLLPSNLWYKSHLKQ